MGSDRYAVSSGSERAQLGSVQRRRFRGAESAHDGEPGPESLTLTEQVSRPSRYSSSSPICPISAEQQAEEIKAKAAQTQTEAATGWQTMKDNWHSHVAELHQKADDKKAEADARRAELKAEAAEDYADDAISFAIAAVQEAEYAVMDAILARSDAEALAGTS